MSRRSEIVIAVQSLHRKVWNSKRPQFTSDDDPVDLLDPSIAARMLGYQYEEVPDFPNWPPASSFRTAGLVDPQQKLVRISQQFTNAERRFTGAHEIGHIVLHPELGLHRDRPIEGPSQERQQQPLEERQADIFASLYLMPENLLKKRILATFLTAPPIKINDDIAFWLDPNDHERVLREPANSHVSARNFAKCSNDFSGKPVVPLHEQFKVSISAMAYRIEELRLLEN